MADNDACPSCGEHVEAVTSYSIGTGHPSETRRPMNEPNQQATTCPKCGASLRRLVGEPWVVATPPGADTA